MDPCYFTGSFLRAASTEIGSLWERHVGLLSFLKNLNSLHSQVPLELWFQESRPLIQAHHGADEAKNIGPDFKSSKQTLLTGVIQGSLEEQNS